MFLNMVVQHSALLRKLDLNAEDFYVKTIGWGYKIMFLTMKCRKWAISMLQTKDKWLLRQLQQKSQNPHSHIPAANSLLLQKLAWHIATHFVMVGNCQTTPVSPLIKILFSSSVQYEGLYHITLLGILLLILVRQMETPVSLMKVVVHRRI